MYDLKALYEAESVQDAVRLRLEHPQAQIIAGGTDVLVQMREGKRAGVELISIYGIDELRGVTLDGRVLVADPNSRERSLAAWDPELILSELSPSRNNGAPLWRFPALGPAS